MRAPSSLQTIRNRGRSRHFPPRSRAVLVAPEVGTPSSSASSTALRAIGRGGGSPGTSGNIWADPVLRFGSLASSLMRATSSSSGIFAFWHTHNPVARPVPETAGVLPMVDVSVSVGIGSRMSRSCESRCIFLVAGEGFEPSTLGFKPWRRCSGRFRQVPHFRFQAATSHATAPRCPAYCGIRPHPRTKSRSAVNLQPFGSSVQYWLGLFGFFNNFGETGL
jgi:hypothetical protein